MSDNTGTTSAEGFRRAVAEVDDVAVAADGLRVEKTFDVGNFSVPTVVYRIESDREEVVDLTLRDPLPEGFPTDRIGFHEEFERDRWRLVDGAVVFERTLAPGESVRTVYGVQIRSPAAVERFMNRPTLSASTVQVADPSLGADDAATTDPSPGTDDAATTDEGAGASDPATAGDLDAALAEAAGDETSASDGGGTTAPVDGDAVWAREDVDPLDRALSGGTDGEASVEAVLDGEEFDADGRASADDAPAADAGATAATDGDVAGRLVEQLRAGEVSEGDRKRLSRELNLRTSEATRDLLDGFRERLDRKRDRLREEIEALEDEVDQLYGHTADAESLTQLERAVDELEARKADDEAVAHLRSAVDDLDGSKAEADALSRLDERVDRLAETAAEASALSALADRVDDLETTAATRDETVRLRESVEAVEASMATETRVEDLAGDLATLSDRAAAADRLAAVADTVGTLDDTAARRESVRELDAQLTELERTAATADRVEALEETLADLDDRVEELASGMAALEGVAAEESELQALADRVESEYVTTADVDEALDERVRAGAADVVAQVVGASGLLVAGLLAATGASAALAVVPFLVGALALGTWAYRVR
jgi:hypothetical protein